MISRKKSLRISFTYTALVLSLGFNVACTPNKKLPESKQNDKYQASQRDIRSSNMKNIFSYDTLAMLNANNLIKKQIRGRWQLDSIIFEGKIMNTKLILNGMEIEALDFKSNFYLKSSTKSNKGVYFVNQVGVYFIDNNNLFIKEVNGTSINNFQIDKSSERNLILSEKFRNGIKRYWFSLDLEYDKSNRTIYGPNYK